MKVLRLSLRNLPTPLNDQPPNQAVRRGEGVREVREGDAGAAGDAVQAAGRLHGAQPQEDSMEDPLEVSEQDVKCVQRLALGCVNHAS